MIKEISILDYLSVLVKWKKTIFINFFIVSVLAVIISLCLPKWYRANATIMPPIGTNDILGLSGILSDLPAIGGFGLSPTNTQGEIYIAILNSRTVLDSVISKFDLQNLYDKKTLEDTRRSLSENMNAELNDDGTISLSVEASTDFFSFGDNDTPAKILSCNLTNYFIAQLDSVNKRLRSEQAKNNRQFVEKRYFQNLLDLERAEEKVKSFQKEHAAVSLPEQVLATISAMAELKGRIISKDVELNVLRKYVGNTHSDFLYKQTELAELQKKYENFLNMNKQSNDVYLPFHDLPDLSLEYARLYRDVLIEQKIQEFLLPQYEQAKIQEVRDTPTIQILDYAVPPERKARPKRAYIVLFAGFMALILSLIACYIVVNLEYIKSTNPAKYQQIKDLMSNIRRQKK